MANVNQKIILIINLCQCNIIYMGSVNKIFILSTICTISSVFNAVKTNPIDIHADDEKIRIEEVSDVVFLDAPYRQHFCVYFNKSIGDERVLGLANEDVPEYSDSIASNILINGSSVKYINKNGVNYRGEPILRGIDVNIEQNGNDVYGFHIFINDKLAANYGSESYKLKLDDTDIITFKSGLTYNDFTLTEDLNIHYYETISDWKKEQDLIDNNLNMINYVSTPVYEPTQHLYYFYLKFENNPADKFIPYASYDSMLDNLYYESKSFKEICDIYGENAAFVRFQSGESMNVDYDGYLLYIHISENVINELGLKKDSKLSISSDLVLPSLANLDKDYEYYYDIDNKFWLSTKEQVKEYSELSVRDVSNAVFDSVSGNYYFVLYFEQDVSYHYLPQVNADLDWLESVYNESNPICYYSNSFLQALIYDHIKESIMDYMFINGKSIRELCDSEQNLDRVRNDQSIVVNYCGAQFDSTAIQVLFNGLGSNKYDESKEYMVEIKKGFISPLHGKTTKDYKMILGRGLIIDNEENVPEKKENIANVGLIVGLSIGGTLIVAGAIFAFIFIRRRKHAKV